MPKLLSLDDLKALIECDLRTGVLLWKERAPEYFARGALATSWNKKYCGKRALHTMGNHGYFYGHLLRQKLLAHRVIWYLAHEVWPDEVDHINGDRSDNRLCNLRNVSHQANCCNRALQSNNRSGVVGVLWNKQNSTWLARIQRDGKVFHLGFHNDFEKAVAARKSGETIHNFHPNHGRQAYAKISSN